MADWRPSDPSSDDGPPYALQAQDLWAGYNSQPALEGVSFAIAKGHLVALVGPNGSGKSTLLRVILGLHRPWRGEVRVLGAEGARPRRHLGYMPQVELVDWTFPVTAFDVVMMGRYGRLGLLRRPGRGDRQVVWQCLERVGMADLAGRQMGELSAGQQRRVLIARSLAQEADILLLDEPMTGLDATAQHDLLTLLERLHDGGRTILMVTHDLSCDAPCFDRVLLMNRQVIAYGRPDAVFTQENLRRAFLHRGFILAMQGPPGADNP